MFMWSLLNSASHMSEDAGWSTIDAGKILISWSHTLNHATVYHLPQICIKMIGKYLGFYIRHHLVAVVSVPPAVVV